MEEKIIKPFSEDIDGSNLYEHPGTEPEDYAENCILDKCILDKFTPEDVTMEMIRHGSSLKAKMELYFRFAGITNSKHRKFIENAIGDNWVDWEFLDPGGFQGEYYNTNLLEVLQGYDREATYTGERGVGTHMPSTRLAQIEKELEELVKKKVPGLSLQDQQRMWKTGGLVPSWWDPAPTTKSLTYYMKRIIQGTGNSAADVEGALKRASAGKMTAADKRLIRLGFPAFESKKIIEGRRKFNPKMMKSIRGFGEFYHKDVGWY